MDQKLVTKAQDALELTIKLFEMLEAQSCGEAAGDAGACAANADFTIAKSYLGIAKGYATKGATAMPGVEPRFGGK